MTRTREEVIKLYDAYLAGDTLSAIAEREGCSHSRIGQLFEYYDLPRRKASLQRQLVVEHRAQEQRGHIIALYKQFGNLDDVVKRVNLPRRPVAEIVNTIPNREMYRRRGQRTSRSRSELIRDLKRAAECKGVPLTIPGYRGVARELGLAASNTQVKEFGSWSNALEAAHIEGNEPLGPRDNSITPEECVEAVARCWREYQRRPSYEVYTRWAKGRQDVPSGASVRLKLKTWNEAVQAALELLGIVC